MLTQLTRMARNRDEVIASSHQGLASVHERGRYADMRQYVATANYFRTRL